MNARDDQVLFEKLQSLPPQQRAEVEDFVDFLAARAKKRIAVNQLFDAMGKLAGVEPPLTEDEIDVEIAAARADRARRR
jgi:hypothetical protein